MNSKIAFGSAMLVLVATLFGVVGAAVPPASARPIKPTLNGCTEEQLYKPNPLIDKCVRKTQEDLVADKPIADVHTFVCNKYGIYCCGKEGGGRKCTKIK